MINAVENDSIIELWHKRLSYIVKKGKKLLAKKNFIFRMKSTKLKKRVHCMLGKQTRVSFKNLPSSQATSKLDLVHSNLCGPMKMRIIRGALYFVTFINDHLRKMWFYTLRLKDQVLDMFKQFYTLVERETRKKLKCIQIDNKGEYLGLLDEYYRKQGIRHLKTPPNPQLNGVVEKMNMTLVERVRFLLSHTMLSNPFWGEALNTIVYLLNLSLCVPLDL